MTEQLTTEAGYQLRYIVPHEAWYWRSVHSKALTITKAADEGGCAWEFDIVQVENIGLQVQIFDDAWSALTEIAPLFAALADERPASLGAVRALLEEFGIRDKTEREYPCPPGARVCACGCPESSCTTETREAR